MILVRGDLEGIIHVRDLSRKSTRSIKQNPFFTSFHNAGGLLLAAGVPCSFVELLLSPMIGSATMSLGSASVVRNML